MVRDRIPPGIFAISLGNYRIDNAPVGGNLLVIPRDSELVIRVVVAVDEVDQREIRASREPVSDTGRNENSVFVVAEVADLCRPLGRRPKPQIVEDDPRVARASRTSNPPDGSDSGARRSNSRSYRSDSPGPFRVPTETRIADRFQRTDRAHRRERPVPREGRRGLGRIR